VGDMLRQGSQWLEQMRTQHCSSPVTYRRGATEAQLNATYGRTEYEVEDDYGLRIAAHVTDFLILAADFTPTFGEPEAGDVMSLGSQGHWRWSDPHRQAMRIHTKETGAE